MELRKHYLLVILLVIRAFHIDLQESVEYHLGCLDREFLASLV